jgi:lipopolysaccharide/colanic/teichoic acid biosynthesis glycosyltransferase
MYSDAEHRLRTNPQLYDEYVENGFKLPEGRDPRITRVGRLLRKSSLDELPQIVSILTGSMSLVGPRPVLPDELPTLYGDLAGYYLAVRPGLTGLWQVSGRSRVLGSERAVLDADYVAKWRFSTDMRIVVRTVPAVLHGTGAH